MKAAALFATLCVAAGTLKAQNPASPPATVTAHGDVELGDSTVFYEPTGKPCYGLAHGRSVRSVAIKSDLYVRGMITPDSGELPSQLLTFGRIDGASNRSRWSAGASWTTSASAETSSR